MPSAFLVFFFLSPSSFERENDFVELCLRKRNARSSERDESDGTVMMRLDEISQPLFALSVDEFLSVASTRAFRVRRDRAIDSRGRDSVPGKLKSNQSIPRTRISSCDRVSHFGDC